MKTRTITLNKSSIFADVDAITFARYRAARQEGQQRSADAIATDTQETLDYSLISRLAQNWISNLRQILDYYCTSATATTASDVPDAGAVYTISLSISDEFMDSLLSPLASLCHRYVVEGVVKDWYGNLAGQTGNDGDQTLSNIEYRIKEMIFRRRMPAL